MIDKIAKSLRESLHIAADIAGDMTRIARARLDIASTKKDIRRNQAALGAFVHENLTQTSLAGHPQVQAWTDELNSLQEQLAQREEALKALQKEQAARTDTEPNLD